MNYRMTCEAPTVTVTNDGDTATITRVDRVLTAETVVFSTTQFSQTEQSPEEQLFKIITIQANGNTITLSPEQTAAIAKALELANHNGIKREVRITIPNVGTFTNTTKLT